MPKNLFTIQEADIARKSVNEIYHALSEADREIFLPHLKQICLYIGATRERLEKRS